MGQKVNPHGLRVGVIKNWDSRWFASDEKFGDLLVSDYKVRKYLKEKLYEAGIPNIEIERDHRGKARVIIHCAKPGMIIGRAGSEISKLKADLEKMMGCTVAVDVVEVKPIELDAQLVAESIASSLERRIAFRRAMKQAIGRTMRLGAKGIKVSCGGRLGGAEIARSEHYHEGTIPLQTLRADIDYGFAEANTTYGKIGVKVWIYKGEILSEVNRTGSQPDYRKGKGPRDRKDRRPGDRDRRDRGFDRGGKDFRGNKGQGRPDNRPAMPQRAPRFVKKPAPAPAPTPAAEEGGAE
ncbi:MAG: 30S ribosomal protein S3 [Clostridia bacterium]|nr:30S ribosomal protein S3 [Clostridia bacterium]